MLDELFESAKKTLLERLSNPLVTSFVISWCLWNWKFLVILFSNNSVSQTFKLVATLAFPDLLTCLTQGFFLPLISTAIYIFILPYPSQFVYAFTLKRQREANEVKQKIQNETLLSVEESIRLKDEFREYERITKEKIDSLNEEVIKLSSRSERAKMSKGNKLSTESQNFEPSAFDIEVLQLVSQHKDHVLKESIINNIGKSRVKTEYSIGELLKFGLLQSSHNFNGDVTITLTHDGRKILLENNENI